MNENITIDEKKKRYLKSVFFRWLKDNNLFGSFLHCNYISYPPNFTIFGWEERFKKNYNICSPYDCLRDLMYLAPFEFNRETDNELTKRKTNFTNWLDVCNKFEHYCQENIGKITRKLSQIENN